MATDREFILAEARPVPVRFWYVAFHIRDPEYWSERWFTRHGMRHVRAAGYSPQADVWVIYNVHARGTWIEVLPNDDVDGRLDYVFAGCRVLKIRARPSSRFIFRPFFTCVEAVKHLTGVRSSAWTPYGLYCDMLAQGAEIAAFEVIHGCRRRTEREPGTETSPDSQRAPGEAGACDGHPGESGRRTEPAAAPFWRRAFAIFRGRR